MKIIEYLYGKKTYIVAVLIGLATMARYAGWLSQDNYEIVMGLLGAGGFAALRAGVAKSNQSGGASLGLLVCLLVAGLVAACASSSVGKGVQVAHAQKQLVEAVTVEVIKLHAQGRIPEPEYFRAKAAYGRWAAAEASLAESLAAWKAVSSAQNEERLTAALGTVGRLTDEYLKLVGPFVDIGAVQRSIKASVTQPLVVCDNQVNYYRGEAFVYCYEIERFQGTVREVKAWTL